MGTLPSQCQLFKVALAERTNGLKMFAAILPNDHNPAEPLRDFISSVASVQEATGLDFFHTLPSHIQAPLEATPSTLN